MDSSQVISFEEHPFPAFCQSDANALIIGSFPSIKLTRKVLRDSETRKIYQQYLTRYSFIPGKDIAFYYGNADNYFWPLLRRLYGLALNNPQDIRLFLAEHRMGITDLFERCARRIRQGRINSADSNLIVLEHRDLHDLLRRCSSLKRIFCTSQWVYRRFQSLYSHIDLPVVILESPSRSYDKYLGGLEEYRQRKRVNREYNTFLYRLEKYRSKLIDSERDHC